MLVSVIVPIYNVEKYLSQCLESIVNQSYRELEIILVDDGSTDGSSEIAEIYKVADSRVNLIRQSNQGLSGARNTGLSVATGEFVIFLDSDDWLKLDIIERAVDAVHEDIDLVVWSYERVFDSHMTPGAIWYREDCEFTETEVKHQLLARLIGPSTQDLNQLMSVDNFSMAWAKMYRLSILKSTLLHFEPTQIYGSEDVLFNMEFLYECKGVIFLNYRGYMYRKDNQSSLTKNHGNTLYNRLMMLYVEMERRIEFKGILVEDFQERLNRRRAISFVNVSLAICSKRNPQGFWEKYKEISKLVVAYKLKVASLKFRKLKLHWLLFFLMLRMGLTAFLFVYIYAVRLFVNR